MIPLGYRSALVTSLLAVLGFLLLLRFIALEPGSGPWTAFQVGGLLSGGAAVNVLFFVLWRALQPEDERLAVYRRTLHCFRNGIYLLLVTFLVFIVDSLLTAAHYHH